MSCEKRKRTRKNIKNNCKEKLLVSEGLDLEFREMGYIKKNRSEDVDVWSYVQQQIKQFETNIDSVFRRNTGSYFTDFDLAFDMVESLFEYLPSKKISYIIELTFLEPCVGIGPFVFAFLKKLYLLGASQTCIRKMVYNIYVVDIHNDALVEYFRLLNILLSELWDFQLSETYIQSNISSQGLIFHFASDEPQYIALEDLFPNMTFDIVLTNPPYKIFKADKNKYMDDATTDKTKRRYAQYKTIVQTNFSLAHEGVTNVYKLFLEEILLNYTKQDALIGVLIPNTILSDKTCSLLRKHLLFQNTILEITTMSENSKVVDANQALVSIIVKKEPSTSKMKLFSSYPNKDFIWLDINSIIDSYTHDSIVCLQENELAILNAIRDFPRIKELSFIHNKRGELDLTKHRSSIALSPKKYRLIRGRHVGFFHIKEDPTEWIDEDFVRNSAKKSYIKAPRLVCQQIANLKQERRLIFSYISEDHVVGNSCNFIAIDSNPYDIDLYILLGILNSSVLNWFFKLFSSNNHVNNYEIDSFPIPIESPFLRTIGQLVKHYLHHPDEILWQVIEKQVLFAYGLSSWDLFEDKSKNITYDKSAFQWDAFYSQVKKFLSVTDDKEEKIKKEKIENQKIIEIVCSNMPLELQIQQIYPTLPSSKQVELIDQFKEFRIRIQKEQFDVALFMDLKNFCPKLYFAEVAPLLNEQIDVADVLKNHDISCSFDKKVITLLLQKYQKLSKGYILNHTTFKLSDLDMEMVVSIPPGGNWQNIPQETINKSERLKKIQKTGGRTTLYGRLHYEHPSYTITTYFNRPGNGTYIHPKLNRVLSVREAARLQSFRDSYFFTGNQTAILNQVGNAVPPKLAFHLGMSIQKKIDCSKSLDLFCGAGGFSVGLADSGIKTMIATDCDESACVTFRLNHPHTKVIWGDVSKEDIKNTIIEQAMEHKIDMICGGPPCQGFSYAGKRFIDDPRNQMVFHYLDIVQTLKPKVALVENVEGMLTAQKGQVYKEILSLFSDIGYQAVGRKIWAHHFGVPQKRKRVVIIAVRNDIDVLPNELFPNGIEKDDEWISVYDSLKDLEDIPCSSIAIYQQKPIYDNPYLREIRS